MAGEPSEIAGRAAAYGDLVSAVLDLRSTAPTREFDALVQRAVAEGRLSEDLARELKWLQRQSLRELVAHAEQVLPATLVALEGASTDVEPPLDDTTVTAAPQPAPQATTDPAARPWPTPGVTETEPEPPTAAGTTLEPEPRPPVDLTARRLLVAGLRPIDDPPFP